MLQHAIDRYIEDKNLGSKEFVSYEEILEDIQSESILDTVRESITEQLKQLKREEL